ncbi:hypothetical protein WUBG_16912, partial [Wuchereria bancrofti]
MIKKCIILRDDDSILRTRRRSGRFFLLMQFWFCLESMHSSRFYMIYTAIGSIYYASFINVFL